MKLARLIDPRFQNAVKKLSSANLPILLAFRLKSIVKTMQDAIDNYEAVRVDLLKRLGKKKEDGELDLGEGGTVQFEEGGLQTFAKEISVLSNSDIDVPTIKLSELGSDINVSLEDAEMLEGLIIEE